MPDQNMRRSSFSVLGMREACVSCVGVWQLHGSTWARMADEEETVHKLKVPEPSAKKALQRMLWITCLVV